MMNIDKDEQFLRKRLQDLANTAYNRGICVFTDFLNLNEQNIAFSLKHELPRIKYFTNGGFMEAERKILCFCDDDQIEEDEIAYPIACIKVEPLNQKFSDSLNHRDFLGAVLNLGIERTKIGDIIIDTNEGYLFVHKGISEFIMEELTRVKHTQVKTSLMDKQEFHYQPKVKEVTGTVSSVRLDSILSVAFNTSRSSLSGLIEGGKVSVGGKLIVSNSFNLKEDDIVSVRGMGKFKYIGTSYQTKKGRYSVKVHLYIT